MDGCRLIAYRVNHNVLCYGYSIEIDRAGKFDAVRAKEQEIPLKYWSRLQKGEQIEENGICYTPDMVLGAPRKGIKLTYCTDTRPTQSLVENACMQIFLYVRECMENREKKKKQWNISI